MPDDKNINIAVVIPAYNEEKTIGNVISTVKKVELIDQIVVVSDGSTDNTYNIASSFDDIKAIRIEKNSGKGKALKTGVNYTGTDILLFLDADLIGLKAKHIEDLLYPLINDETDMSIGVFEKGRFLTDLSQRIAPYISGQRAIRKWIFQSIPDIENAGYGIEIMLTRYTKEKNLRIKKVPFVGVTHIMKEEKIGYIKGLISRAKMYEQIIKTCIKTF